MNCKICNSNTTSAFTVKVLRKYDTEFLQCMNCGFLFSSNPIWLEEAYKNAITLSDTGIIQRNQQLSRSVSAVVSFFFNKQGEFLDFAGGYGLFTRIMRDLGFNFFWIDKYCENLFAKGFEHIEGSNVKYKVITAFEVFEHLVDPVTEMENILSYGSNLIFSTQLLPSPTPKPDEWWYYQFDQGQHISFYTSKSLKILAERFALNYYSANGIHILTKQNISKVFLRIILTKPVKSILSGYRLKFKSWTEKDSRSLTQRDNNQRGF